MDSPFTSSSPGKALGRPFLNMQGASTCTYIGCNNTQHNAGSVHLYILYIGRHNTLKYVKSIMQGASTYTYIGCHNTLKYVKSTINSSPQDMSCVNSVKHEVERQRHNKQVNYTEDSTSFFQGKKESCPGWDSNPRHTAVYAGAPCVQANMERQPTGLHTTLYKRYTLYRIT